MRSIVYNQDCLEAMRQMPDKAFDLAIVDPPYGLNITKIWGSAENGYRQWDKKEWDKMPPPSEYFAELRRVSRNQIVWGANHFIEAFASNSAGWVIWDKGQRDFTLADGEMAWTSFDRAMRIFNYSRAKMQQENRIHINQKPVALYKWLLTNYAKQGDTILDTHLGSGSSRIAAYDLGFDFTGYELDKDYFEAQEQRFANHIAQAKLFDAPVLETVEQNNLF